MGKGLAEFEQQMTAVNEDIDLYSYYQLLGINEDASVDLVTYNYNLKVYEYEQVKKRDDCTPTLVKTLAVLLDRLDEARRVLTDEELRTQYDTGLEMGQTRHGSVLALRGRKERSDAARGSGATDVTVRRQPAAKREEQQQRVTHDIQAPTQEDDYVDEAVRHLEHKLAPELLDAGEPEPDNAPPPPMDREDLRVLTEVMARKLAQAGVEFRVRDDFDDEGDHSPIDPEYLRMAVATLQHKLFRLGVSLDDEGAEAEDVSADADYASGLVAELQAELAAMGLDMFDVGEVVDEAPEELYDADGNLIERPRFDPLQEMQRPKGQADQEAPSTPIAADLQIDVERLMERGTGEHAAVPGSDYVIELDEPPGPTRFPNQVPVKAAPPYEDDAVPRILLGPDTPQQKED